MYYSVLDKAETAVYLILATLRFQNVNILESKSKWVEVTANGIYHNKTKWERGCAKMNRKEDACDRTKWRGVVKTMTIRNLAKSVDGDNTGSNM